MSRIPNPMQPLPENDAEYFCSTFLSSHDSESNETEFCDFYAFILFKLYPKFKVSYGMIRDALRSVRKYVSPGTSGPLPDYELCSLRLAYIFSYGIIHSVVTYDRFLDMLKINPTMLTRIQSMSELNLCILGGGPGFEAAVICQLLNKAKIAFKSVSSSQLQVNITVVDLYQEWETVTNYIFTYLKKEFNPLIKVHINYVQANLTKELTPAVLEAIKSAHIVTMFKFVFEVCHRYGSKNVEKMLKRIVRNMSFKSCLFFLDNAGGGYFKTIDEKIDRITSMERIYGPVFHHCQELKDDTVERYSSFVRDRFRGFECTSKTTISCSAWLKIRHPGKKILEKLEKLDVNCNEEIDS